MQLLISTNLSNTPYRKERHLAMGPCFRKSKPRNYENEAV